MRLAGAIRRLAAHTLPCTVLLCGCIGTFAFIAGRLTQTSTLWRRSIELRHETVARISESDSAGQDSPGAQRMMQSSTAFQTAAAHHPPSIMHHHPIRLSREKDNSYRDKYYQKKYRNYKHAHNEKNDASQQPHQLKPLLAALKHISSGLRHTRSAKARTELLQAHAILRNTLTSSLNGGDFATAVLTPPRPAVLDQQSEPSGAPDVCPEVWRGNKHGYPYYYTGRSRRRTLNTAAKNIDRPALKKIFESQLNSHW